jgi:cysteine synthase A
MPLANHVARSPLELIGATPVVRLNSLSGPDVATVWAKLESRNPGGSVKDRIALAMIDAAERAGHLSPGATIIESTGGNTGVGLALVAAIKGYRLALVVPDTLTRDRRSLLQAYGADLVLTTSDKGLQAAAERAEELAAEHPAYFMPRPFANRANPDIHRRTTAREIIEQVPELDAFVAGVGTGGTITGIGTVLRAERPSVRIVAVEPAASPVLSGGTAGDHGIDGIGAGFVPAALDRTAYDEVRAVSDADAVACARRLAREEGLLVGTSSGAACHVALDIARELGPGRTVVVLFPDTGERYLTAKLFGEGQE